MQVHRAYLPIRGITNLLPDIGRWRTAAIAARRVRLCPGLLFADSRVVEALASWQNTRSTSLKQLYPGQRTSWDGATGAVIALLISIFRQDPVQRLVSVSELFNTSSIPAQDHDWIRSATPESFRKSLPMLVKRYEEATPDGPAHFPVRLEKTKRLWLNEPDIQRGELAKITAPTLVMVGDRDAIIPEHTLELFRSIKGAQLCVTPDTTHFLLSEKPSIANRVILEFLQSRPKPKE